MSQVGAGQGGREGRGHEGGGGAREVGWVWEGLGQKGGGGAREDLGGAGLGRRGRGQGGREGLGGAGPGRRGWGQGRKVSLGGAGPGRRVSLGGAGPGRKSLGGAEPGRRGRGQGEAGRVWAWTYLIVRLGVVVQRQDVLQEDVELSRHVLEQHPVVVALLDLAHLLLEEDTQEIPGQSRTLTWWEWGAVCVCGEGGQTDSTLSLIFLQGSWPTANSTSM